MKHIRLSTITGLSLRIFLFLSLVSALPRTAAEEYKIGVVDALAVLEQSPQAEHMADELRKEFEGRNRELIDMQKQLTELNDRLRRDAEILNQTEISNLERQLYLQNKELERAEAQYKEDFSFRRNEILDALQNDIVAAIQAVSQQYEFDIVLTGGVNWATARMNITPLVIEYLKNQSK